MAGIIIAFAVFLYISNRPEPASRPEPRPFVWKVDIGALNALTISLSPEGKSEAWVKHDDGYWYFNRSEGPRVNMARWGGGIPLLLSGPGAERLIADDSTAEELARYGLQNPNMTINLTLENEDSITIDVGDRTPDGQAYYVKLTESRDVYTVHHTWYDVLERLVLDPPYPETGEE